MALQNNVPKWHNMMVKLRSQTHGGEAYSVSQRNVLIEQITTKIECCGAKFYHGHDLGRLDQAKS